MFGTRSDLALRRDDASRFLPWILALQVYFAVVALATLIGLQDAIERWRGGDYAVITVELPADADDASVAAAIEVMRRTPGIAAARELDPARVAGLLEPWLGPGVAGDVLPLPRLVDVTRAPGAGVDWADATERLEQAAPRAVLDRGTTWTDQLAELARWAQGLAAAIVAVVVVVSAIAVIFAIRAGLAIHHDTIELLHLLGAEDSYIIGQFETHALGLALRGGVLGLGAGAATLVAAGVAGARLEAPLLPALGLGPAGWAALIVVPAITALIAMITARFVVARTLARLP